MKPITIMLSALALLVLLPVAATAQQDAFGAIDTVWAEVSRINDDNWSINLSYFNDEPIVGMSIPLKLSAGLNRIVADSCVYTGGRVEHFNVRAFRADTAIQCVTLGMIASLSAKKVNLLPGKGRLATIFVSSLTDEPIEGLTVDTTTTHPSNSLEIIADSVQGEPPDTVKVTDKTKRTIIPIFLSIASK
ncbi:MAG TPA: hypothetical protein VMY05_00135 [Acidobacteriota bacterium]|nr:hypothetical protein [Acidobacteriota bacterium]